MAVVQVVRGLFKSVGTIVIRFGSTVKMLRNISARFQSWSSSGWAKGFWLLCSPFGEIVSRWPTFLKSTFGRGTLRTSARGQGAGRRWIHLGMEAWAYIKNNRRNKWWAREGIRKCENPLHHEAITAPFSFGRLPLDRRPLFAYVQHPCASFRRLRKRPWQFDKSPRIHC